MSTTSVYEARRDFIVQNATRMSIKELAENFFKEFNLTSKGTALDALHVSLNATNHSELAKLLKEDDVKEWLAYYFMQTKSQKKLSIENIVEKERNKLQVTGVLKGSMFIKSGMDLLAPMSQVQTPELNPSRFDKGEKTTAVGAGDTLELTELTNASNITTTVSSSSSASSTVASLTSESNSENDAEPVAVANKVFFDFSAVEPIDASVGDVEVGHRFYELQRKAAPIVNDATKKLDLNNLHLFLREMARTGRIRAQGRVIKDDEEENVFVLFLSMSKKLAEKNYFFTGKLEDTFAHGALDPMLSFLFPADDRTYVFDWANRPSLASGARRRDPLKPDATIQKYAFETAYVEIKSPKDERNARFFLEDQWNLIGFAKDTIDENLRCERAVTEIPCLQVFGYQLTLYRMTFHKGVYVWQTIDTAYLPRDKHDCGSMISSLELLQTFKV
ncbi:hypothetical protein DFQ26_006355 [Actinomortierella ambigua]|nr:hypothetical protein DFQ26_006355 [Actinomortierella ambigua]